MRHLMGKKLLDNLEKTKNLLLEFKNAKEELINSMQSCHDIVEQEKNSEKIDNELGMRRTAAWSRLFEAVLYFEEVKGIVISERDDFKSAIDSKPKGN